MPTVYKYLAPNTAKLVLEAGRLRFTQPGAFNDPFEFTPCLSRWKAKAVEKAVAKMNGQVR